MMRKVLFALSLIVLWSCTSKYEKDIKDVVLSVLRPFGESYITSATLYIDDKHGWIQYHFYKDFDYDDEGEYPSQYERFLDSLDDWLLPNYVYDGYQIVEHNKELAPVIKYAMRKFKADLCVAYLGGDELSACTNIVIS